MSSRREQQRLRDIIVNIDAIRSYVRDMSLAAFMADQKTIDATERCLQRITEAVIKIGSDRMAMIAPAIPAEAIRGFGNVLRHEYDEIDLQSLFNTVLEDLPLLYAACVAALDEPT